MVDTSFSDPSASDRRGRAVYDVSLHFDDCGGGGNNLDASSSNNSGSSNSSSNESSAGTSGGSALSVNDGRIRWIGSSRVAIKGLLASGERVACFDVSKDPLLGRRTMTQQEEEEEEEGAAATTSMEGQKKKTSSSGDGGDEDLGGGWWVVAKRASEKELGWGGDDSAEGEEKDCDYYLSRTEGHTVTTKWAKATELAKGGVLM
jgi:hypothetical protein